LIILSLIQSGEVEVEDFDTDARSKYFREGKGVKSTVILKLSRLLTKGGCT